MNVHVRGKRQGRIVLRRNDEHHQAGRMSLEMLIECYRAVEAGRLERECLRESRPCTVTPTPPLIINHPSTPSAISLVGIAMAGREKFRLCPSLLAGYKDCAQSYMLLLLTAMLTSGCPVACQASQPKICRASGCGQEGRWLRGGGRTETKKVAGLFQLMPSLGATVELGTSSSSLSSGQSCKPHSYVGGDAVELLISRLEFAVTNEAPHRRTPTTNRLQPLSRFCS
ncbi:hypothetical protein J3F83DRAFT_241722 [Trichoderma novae-zelandiae]